METSLNSLLTALLPDLPSVQFESCSQEENTLTLHFQTTASPIACPQCGVHSSRVKSRYRRTVWGPPLGGSRGPDLHRIAQVRLHQSRVSAPNFRRASPFGGSLCTVDPATHCLSDKHRTCLRRGSGSTSEQSCVSLHQSRDAVTPSSPHA